MKKVKSKKTTRDRLFAFIHWFEKWIFRVIYPYKRYGNLKKYDEGALLLVSNHYSLLDMAYAVRVTDRHIHFIAKDSLWRGGILEWFVTSVGCIPVKRDGSDVQALKSSIKILREGGVITIYPEGTRNKTGEDMLPFKSGAAALSIKTQTPIIPIVQLGKMKLFRRNYVIYGDPVEFREYYGKKLSKTDIEECDNRLREAMINMRKAFMEKYKIGTAKK